MELSDFAAFDSDLVTVIQCQPDVQMRLLESAARETLRKSVLQMNEQSTPVFN